VVDEEIKRVKKVKAVDFVGIYVTICRNVDGFNLLSTTTIGDIYLVT
jgi:hypothetical protein